MRYQSPDSSLSRADCDAYLIQHRENIATGAEPEEENDSESRSENDSECQGSPRSANTAMDEEAQQHGRPGENTPASSEKTEKKNKNQKFAIKKSTKVILGTVAILLLIGSLGFVGFLACNGKKDTERKSSDSESHAIVENKGTGMPTKVNHKSNGTGGIIL